MKAAGESLEQPSLRLPNSRQGNCGFKNGPQPSDAFRDAFDLKRVLPQSHLPKDRGDSRESDCRKFRLQSIGYSLLEVPLFNRSEERRVGKEGSSGGWPK